MPTQIEMLFGAPRQAVKPLNEKHYMPDRPCRRGHVAPRWINGKACTACVLKPDPIREAASLARAAAKANGDILYYSARPCPKGHVGRRYTKGGACVACLNTLEARQSACIRTAARTAILSPEDRAVFLRIKSVDGARQNKKKRLADPVAARAKDKANRKRLDKAARRKTNQNWRAANREHVISYENARAKHRYHADLEASRLKSRLAALRRRAVKLAVGGSFTADDIERLFLEQGGKCCGFECGGVELKHYEIDHCLAIVRGGSNDAKNLQLLCRSCNARKHTRTMTEWWVALQGRNRSMPKMTFTKPFSMTGADGVRKDYTAGETEVDQSVADSHFAQGHTAEGSSAPAASETEAWHVKNFENRAMTDEAEAQRTLVGQHPAVMQPGSQNDDPEPSADAEPDAKTQAAKSFTAGAGGRGRQPKGE